MKRTGITLKGGVVKLVASRDYRAWINDLRKRYREVRIKAGVSANSALLEFYWNLGKDISEKSEGAVLSLLERHSALINGKSSLSSLQSRSKVPTVAGAGEFG